MGEVSIEEDARSIIDTNSPLESPLEDPIEDISSYKPKTPEDRKKEGFRLIVNWEELLEKSVSAFEKRRFLGEYIRSRSNEDHMLEKILEIKADPYLAERARSINFLFSGFDMALKNKSEMRLSLIHISEPTRPY